MSDGMPDTGAPASHEGTTAPTTTEGTATPTTAPARAGAKTPRRRLPFSAGGEEDDAVEASNTDSGGAQEPHRSPGTNDANGAAAPAETPANAGAKSPRRLLFSGDPEEDEAVEAPNADSGGTAQEPERSSGTDDANGAAAPTPTTGTGGAGGPAPAMAPAPGPRTPPMRRGKRKPVALQNEEPRTKTTRRSGRKAQPARRNGRSRRATLARDQAESTGGGASGPPTTATAEDRSASQLDLHALFLANASIKSLVNTDAGVTALLWFVRETTGTQLDANAATTAARAARTQAAPEPGDTGAPAPRNGTGAERPDAADGTTAKPAGASAPPTQPPRQTRRKQGKSYVDAAKGTNTTQARKSTAGKGSATGTTRKRQQAGTTQKRQQAAGDKGKKGGAPRAPAVRTRHNDATLRRVCITPQPGESFTLQEVESTLRLIGEPSDFHEQRREGVTTRVFVTLATAAQARDALQLPWGRAGQRRTWPKWRVERARPVVTAARRKLRRVNGSVVPTKFHAVPGKGAGRLTWQDAKRALTRENVPRCFVRVRRHARAYIITADVPKGKAGRVADSFDAEVTTTIAGGTWRIALLTSQH